MQLGIRMYQPEDAKLLTKDELVIGDAAPILKGITVLLDGKPRMSCGICPILGVPEAWVAVADDLSPSERITVGRVARSYLGHLNPSVAYAHVRLERPDHVRFAKWLGFYEECRYDTPAGPVARLKYEGSFPWHQQS